MPIPLHSSEAEPTVAETRYPALTKQAAGKVNGVHTDVMSITFADKILVTITQEGRLAQWVQVQSEASTPSLAGLIHLHNNVDDDDGGENGLLPMSHLTPTTILGGTVPERQIVGQLLATQIASALTMKNPQESRMLVLGLGMQKVESDREAFYEIVDLVLRCL